MIILLLSLLYYLLNYLHESLVGGRHDVSLVEGSLTAANVELVLLALVNRYVIASVMADVVLSGSDDLVFGVVKELVPVSKPANCPGDHEQNGEHISREAQSFVNDSAVEINVGVQFSFNEERIAESDAFQFNSNFDKFFLSDNLEDFFSNFFNKFGTRIVVFIDSVSEAIEKTFSVFD